MEKTELKVAIADILKEIMEHNTKRDHVTILDQDLWNKVTAVAWERINKK